MKYLPVFLILCTALLITSCKQHPSIQEESASEAGEAFEHWGAARLFPDGIFHTEKYTEAFEIMRLSAELRGDRSPSWEDIGPKNIGGRTLCLAINPQDTNILWLGSAGGGIWKSETGGRGAAAWHRVETGFPVMGVSALALEPGNPDVIYAGTGEVYNVENAQPSVAIRITRGTYGIGILKSSDGGATWVKSLDWSYGQMRGVQDIKINPLRPATVLAATSEGLMRSWDAGQTWHMIFAQKMAVDIEINPVDTNRIFCSFGSHRDDATSGVYRSTDGGASFQKLTNGIATSYSGKAMLGISPSQPDTMYVSVGNEEAQEGFYMTADGGDSWTSVSNFDVCIYQGWYAHDVAVKPDDAKTFIWTGIDAWKSVTSGALVTHKTYWYLWNFGYVPAGSSEGPTDYVHADIHRAYFSPTDPNKLYLVTDGGLFVSSDAGETFEGRNGGYQSQQFYANIGYSTYTNDLCIGGMQDNGSAIYFGDPSWIRVIGGDGECAAIYPGNDDIMFGSTQYLNMYKSENGGADWYGVGAEINEEAAFDGPFEFAPSNPNIMYAGAKSIWRSSNQGQNWINASSGPIAGGDVILTMAVNPGNPDEVFCSTAPSATNLARVYRFSASNGITQQLAGLPNRYCMDIAFHPSDYNTLFAVFNGFNTQHVYKSSNHGFTWAPVDNGLPDVPTNTILIDPLYPDNVYIGNDLGVWLSQNGGDSWSLYSSEAPMAMPVMHLSISSGRKLRAATHGLGVWQTDMAGASNSYEASYVVNNLSVQPNPASETAVLSFSLGKSATTSIEIVDMSGKQLWRSGNETLSAGPHTRSLPVAQLPAGTYGVIVRSSKSNNSCLLVKRK